MEKKSSSRIRSTKDRTLEIKLGAAREFASIISRQQRPKIKTSKWITCIQFENSTVLSKIIIKILFII